MPNLAIGPRRAALFEGIALVAIAVLALIVYGWIAIGGVGIIGFSDSADYLFFTDFYRGQFAGDIPPEALAFYWNTRFPPLFPLVLATLGGGTHDLQHTQMIACCIAGLMLMMLWWWIRRDSGSALAALAVTFVTVLNPGLFLLTLNPVSEPLAMGMTWLAFLLASRNTLQSDRYLLVALVVGLSALARSINVALVFAVPIWLLMQRARPRQFILGSGIAVTPFLSWLFYRQSIPGTNTYTDGIDLDFVVNELGGWPDLLYEHPWRLVTGFASTLDITPDAFSMTLALALLGAAALGWWLRWRQNRLDAVFLPFYIGILLVWPYPSEATRFMTFVAPLLLYYSIVGIGAVTARVRSPWLSRVPASAVLALICLAASAGTVTHFVALACVGVDPALEGEQREQFYFRSSSPALAVRKAEAFARIRLAAREAVRRVPADDCVYVVMPYLLERHGRVRTRPYPYPLNPTIDLKSQLAECNFFFVVGMPGVAKEEVPFYPYDRLRDVTQPLVVAHEKEGTMLAALLRWKSDDGGTPASRAPEPSSHLTGTRP